MRKFLILLLPFALALGACQAVQRVDTPRERLLVAESAFAVAVQTALTAYRAGVIKPGSDTDKAVDAAIKSGYAALVVWRTSPDSLDYMKAALAAMQPLLNMVAGIKTQAANDNAVPLRRAA
jgi:hypothetical protein